MTQSVPLTAQAHRDLRLLPARAGLSPAPMSTLAFPVEFRQLQAHYPIVFQKSPEGSSFQPVALFGLQEGQNLFLGPEGWDADCVPMAIEREPFLIGRNGAELCVNVDLDSPRLSRAEGEPLFLPHGGPSERLERISSLLLALHEGLEALPAFINALLRHELLESFVLDVERADGTQSRLSGLYTIDEERLAALDGTALGALNAAGHLQPIYMALASVSNFRALIERQRQHASAA